MKKFLTSFFVVLGVLFFMLILAGIYLYVADPLEIKPAVKALIELRSSAPVSPAAVNGNETGSTDVVEDKHPLLTAQQEATLEKVGIDPAALPTEVTPEMQTCAYEKLGEARAKELLAGAEPTAADLLKASSCLSK